MAKVIQYNPNHKPDRKLGFKRVHKAEKLEEQGQLNIFEARNPHAIKQDEPIIRKLRSQLNRFEEALMMDEKGDPKAEQLYIQAIDESSSSADAYCNLGVMYASQGETVKSIGAFTKALSLDPRHLESHYNLANMYFDAGNFELAIIHYQVATEIDESFSEAWYNLALAFASNNQSRDALEAYLNYKKLDSMDSNDKPTDAWFESLKNK